MNKDELVQYAYYVLEVVESGERLVGQFINQDIGFRICGSYSTFPMRLFNVIREVDLS